MAVLTDLPDAGEFGLVAQFAYWRQNGPSPTTQPTSLWRWPGIWRAGRQSVRGTLAV